jgi:hypothetical protein
MKSLTYPETTPLLWDRITKKKPQSIAGLRLLCFY